MEEATIHAVDNWLEQQLIEEDPALSEALATAESEGLPPIQVTPLTGKFLYLLALSVGARRILEVGTLGGYSTIWLARALPLGGTLITLEIDPKHAQVAQKNLERAGQADKVQIKVGPALETLPKLGGYAPFDFIFIDADKDNNPHYFRHAVRFSRPGTLIVVDNVVRGGKVINEVNPEPEAVGVQTLMRESRGYENVTGTALQLVGTKGHDGFALFRVS
ncbi:MAG: O-methyltransferase [Armatimonadetes bacterium]|nr:O-methyltransferase [Armatimonadota bacterium]